MPERMRIIFPPAICGLGMIQFTLAGAWKISILYAIVLLYLFALPFFLRGRERPALFWLPFASGLGIPLMRLFYWDRFDFDQRIRLLLLFSLLLSILRLAASWGIRTRLADAFGRQARKRQLWIIFIVAEILFIAGSLLLTEKGVTLGGDEPHYLAISQSIVRDRDLNVFNQYYRGLYREFIDVQSLPAHGTFGIGPKRIFSYHLPGVSFTLAPFFLAKIPLPLLYILIRSYMGLFGALLAVLLFLFALRLGLEQKLALFVTAAFSFTSPVFFYSLHIAPEIQAMLMVLAALYLLLFPGRRENLGALLAGLLLGATVFWGLKYAIFILLYVPGFFIYFLRQGKSRKAFLLLLAPLLFMALFFLYLHLAYGTLSPNAIYYGRLDPGQNQQVMNTLLRTITWRMRLETLLNYFFDQRDGLLLYNPLYFFALPGLILALRQFRRFRIHLLVATPALLFILNHAMSTIRPGFCPQARYLVPALWALLLFALIYFRETKHPGARQWLSWLSLYAFFVVLYQSLHPATLYQPTTHDVLSRPGLMFQQWSQLKANLSSWLPSFIKIDNSRYLPDYIFPGALLILVIMALRKRVKKRNFSLLQVVGSFLPLLAFFSPRPGLYNPVQVMAGENTTPYYLFEKKLFPAGQESGRRRLTGSGSHAFVIGTPRQPEEAILEVSHLSSPSRATIVVFLGDRKVVETGLEAGKTSRVRVMPGAGIHWQHLLLFPFRLDVSYPEKDTGEGSFEAEWTLSRRVEP